VITAKENMSTEMVTFNSAVTTAKNAGATVEMLFLGGGYRRSTAGRGIRRNLAGRLKKRNPQLWR